MEIAEQYPNGAIRPLSVGMHTAEKKVDSEVGNQHTQECGCAVPVAYTIIVIRAHTSFGSQAQ